MIYFTAQVSFNRKNYTTCHLSSYHSASLSVEYQCSNVEMSTNLKLAMLKKTGSGKVMKHGCLTKKCVEKKPQL